MFFSWSSSCVIGWPLPVSFASLTLSFCHWCVPGLGHPLGAPTFSGWAHPVSPGKCHLCPGHSQIGIPRPTPFPPIPTANSISQLGCQRQLTLASAQFIISAKHMQTLSTPVATALVQNAVSLTWIPAPTFAPQPTEFSQLKLQSDHRPTLFKAPRWACRTPLRVMVGGPTPFCPPLHCAHWSSGHSSDTPAHVLP